MPRAERVVERFALGAPIARVSPLPGGHINQSFHVTAAGGAGYLLQRLNPDVFPDCAAVMENVANVTRYLARRIAKGGESALRAVPALVASSDGAAWVRDDDGTCWRLLTHVRGSAREQCDSLGEARGAGAAFGTFLSLLAEYDGPPLHETLPGFHDTERRFAALAAAVRADSCGRVAQARREIETMLAHQDLAGVLPTLADRGDVPLRIVHNDAKIGNVMFEADTGVPLGVIDFDTVMSGLALYDFGDLVRSAASASDEDELDLARIEARPAFVEALAAGYLEGAGDLLTPRERALLVFAGRLITLEQAVRFLTDHLGGDRYYRTQRPGHNLDRARAQLRLFESLTEREVEIEARVMGLCG